MHDAVRLQVPGGGLGTAMSAIRAWLDAHHIQPSNFHTVPDGGGYLLTISFFSEVEAELFRQRFQARLEGFPPE